MNMTHEMRTIRIGLLAAAALVLLALGVMGITSKQKLFERKVEYFSYFPDAAGLKEGSGVWFQGVEVGFISHIEFAPDMDNPKILVRYRISAALVPRIRTGTRASISSLGLLGDKYLAIMNPPQVGNQANLLPGNPIPADPSLNLEALGRGAQDVIQNTVDISNSLKELLASVNAGEGALPRLLKDPKLGRELLDHLNGVATNLDRVTTGLAEGRGLAGKVLADRKYGDKAAEDLGETLASANEILKSIRDGKGGAGAMISPGGDGAKLVANLAAVSAALKKVAEGMNQPGTLGNKLLNDPVYGEHLAQNLIDISDSTSSILKKIDQGEGSLGLMVNNRDVYDSLAAVARGLKKSKLVNWYIKRTMEKTAKKAKAEAEKQGENVVLE
jgi:phospholipid/cholesterol/gamma-HCH transport system substrate-binding protein